jgi:hypothetical protein
MATDGHGITFTSTVSGTVPQGFKFTPDKNIVLSAITKGSTSNATRVRIWEASADTYGTLLGTATFSGNVATLGTSLTLVGGVKYIIEADNSGSTYTVCYVAASYPISRTDFAFNSGSQTGANQSTYVMNIQTVTYTVVPILTSLNIGDAYKAIDWTGSKINVGDAWKATRTVKVNIADAWKRVYSSPAILNEDATYILLESGTDDRIEVE